MIVSLISAMARDRVIGNNNDLPWDMPADMAHFKRMTLAKPIIMGRQTLASMANRPLPKRRNIVLTRQSDFTVPGVDVCHDLESALALVADEPEVMIIGGAAIYALALPVADRMYLTYIDLDVVGDTQFPQWDSNAWQETSVESHPADDSNPYAYTFRTLERINK